MGLLAARFSPFEDEAVLEVWNFQRRSGESIDCLIPRLEEVRLKAAREGHYTMFIEGWSLIVLKQCDLNQQQLLRLMVSLDHQLPNTEENFLRAGPSPSVLSLSMHWVTLHPIAFRLAEYIYPATGPTQCAQLFCIRDPSQLRRSM